MNNPWQQEYLYICWSVMLFVMLPNRNHYSTLFFLTLHPQCEGQRRGYRVYKNKIWSGNTQFSNSTQSLGEHNGGSPLRWPTSAYVHTCISEFSSYQKYIRFSCTLFLNMIIGALLDLNQGNSHKEFAETPGIGLLVEEEVPPTWKIHTAFWYTKLILPSLLAEERAVSWDNYKTHPKAGTDDSTFHFQ